jgi:hypothetical protein
MVPQPQPAAAPAAAMAPPRRHEMGRAHAAAALNWWLRKAGLSHNVLSVIADWGLGYPGWLLGSQISHLRNANIRSPGLQTFEALAAANEAIWIWQQQGQEAALRRFGVSASGPLIEDAMAAACWLPHPDDTSHPLLFGDWCELFVGLLRLPYVDQVSIAPAEARHLSDAMGSLLDRWVAESGLGLRDGLARLQGLYPDQQPEPLARLRALALGTRPLQARELESELPNLATLVSRLRGVDDGAYGAAELHAELASAKHRA